MTSPGYRCGFLRELSTSSVTTTCCNTLQYGTNDYWIRFLKGILENDNEDGASV